MEHSSFLQEIFHILPSFIVKFGPIVIYNETSISYLSQPALEP